MSERKRKSSKHTEHSLVGYLLGYPKSAGVIAIAVAMIWLVFSQSPFPRGRHNGILLEKDEFAIELTLYDTDVPPEFRAYPYFQERSIDPSTVNLRMEAKSSENIIDKFEFIPEGNFLRSTNVISEFHPSAVIVISDYQGKQYRWSL